MDNPVLLGPDGKPAITAGNGTSHDGAGMAAKELRDWLPPQGSGDSDLLNELSTLVSRSRDLTRNNGVASGGIQTLVDNVVGLGLRLSAKPDYRALGWSEEFADEWARDVEAKWKEFANRPEEFDAARQLTFHGATVQVYRSGLINGEGLALPLWRPRRRDTRYATKFQLVSPDRLSNPSWGMNSEKLRGGIELDSDGGPVAYHIRSTHPGDYWPGGWGGRWKRIRARTSWGRRRVLHIHDPERVGQHRGKPILSPILDKFKMLDHYQRTEIKSAVVSSMVAGFVQSNATPEQLAESFGMSSDDYLAARNSWEGNLEGGALLTLPPGDEFKGFDPGRPNSQFGDFSENVLRNIATGLNIPYELLMKDFSKTNYSSARAAMLEAWRFFQSRRQWLVDKWAQPCFELWLEEAVNKGEVYAPDFYRMKSAYTRSRWIGPGKGWVDPVKEAQAAQVRMQSGLSTLEDECAEQGKDWEEVLQQRSREYARMRELGLEEMGTGQGLMGVVPPSDNEQQPGGQ